MEIIMQFSKILFISLILLNSVHASQSCNESTNVRLDQKGGTLAGLQVQDQDGLGTCYANAASLLLQAEDPYHRRFSYISMAMTHKQGKMDNTYGMGKYNHEKKYYDFFLDEGVTCDVINSVQKKIYTCSQESMQYEDLSTKNKLNSYEAQYDMFEKAKNLNYLFWHSANIKDKENGPRKIIALIDEFIASKRVEAAKFCSQNNYFAPQTIMQDLALIYQDKIANQAIATKNAEDALAQSQQKLESQKFKTQKLQEKIAQNEKDLLALHPKQSSIEELREWNNKKITSQLTFNKDKHQELKLKLDQLDSLKTDVKNELSQVETDQKTVEEKAKNVNEQKLLAADLDKKMSQLGTITKTNNADAQFQDQFDFTPNNESLKTLNTNYENLFRTNLKAKNEDLDFSKSFKDFFTDLALDSQELNFNNYNFDSDRTEFASKFDKDACQKKYVESIFNSDVDTFKEQFLQYGSCQNTNIAVHDKLLSELSSLLNYLSASKTHSVDQLANVVKLMPGNVDLVRAMLGPKCLEGGSIPVPQNACITEYVSAFIQKAGNDKKAAYAQIESKVNSHLNQGSPMVVSVCTEFFNISVDSKQCTDRQELNGEPGHGMHAVTIIGKDCKNGKTRYLIQNSWGEHDCPDNKELECVKNRGAFWVESSILFNNTTRFQYLQ